MHCKKIVFVVLLHLLTNSSFAELYTPTAADAAAQNIRLDYLNQGKVLYLKNCSSCHNLHLPAEYTRMQWVTSINKMQKRAKITDDQKELIFRYLMIKAKK
jgi:mono/diheme cytochrome c family protein